MRIAALVGVTHFFWESPRLTVDGVERVSKRKSILNDRTNGMILSGTTERRNFGKVQQRNSVTPSKLFRL